MIEQNPWIISLITCALLYLISIKRQVTNAAIILVLVGALVVLFFALVAIWGWSVPLLDKLTASASVIIFGGLIVYVLSVNCSVMAHPGNYQYIPDDVAPASIGGQGVTMFFAFGAMAIVVLTEPKMQWASYFGWTLGGMALASLLAALWVIVWLIFWGKK